MKRSLSVGLFVCALAFGSAADAEGLNLDLSVRGGYGVPFGKAASGESFDDFVKGAIPFEIDADFLVTENVSAGIYFTYGFAMISDVAKNAFEADGAEDVSGHRFQRFGLQGIYRFGPGTGLAPWAGLAFGWEWTYFLQAQAAGRDVELGLSGFEFALQGGLDYDVSENLTVGPYATLGFGQFSTYKISIEGMGDTSIDLNDKAMHEWLQIGLKATFSL